MTQAELYLLDEDFIYLFLGDDKGGAENDCSTERPANKPLFQRLVCDPFGNLKLTGQGLLGFLVSHNFDRAHQADAPRFPRIFMLAQFA